MIDNNNTGSALSNDNFDDVVIDSSFYHGSFVGMSGAPDVVDVTVPDWGDWGESEMVSGLGWEE